MDNQNYQPMTIGEWIITFIITYIPIVGIVMLFVWAFGGDTHPSKKTFRNRNSSGYYFRYGYYFFDRKYVWRNGQLLLKLSKFSFNRGL